MPSANGVRLTEHILRGPEARPPLTLGVEAVHHGLHQVQLGFDGEVDEVRVHQDVVRRPELRVVLEEQTGRMLGAAGKTRNHLS